MGRPFDPETDPLTATELHRHNQTAAKHRRRFDFQLFEDFIVYALETLMTQVDDLKAAQAQTLTDVAALSDKVTAVGTQLTTTQAQNVTLLEQLAAAQAAGGTDLTDAISTAQSINSSLETMTATLAADLTPAAPVAPAAPAAPAATDTAVGGNG